MQGGDVVHGGLEDAADIPDRVLHAPEELIDVKTRRRHPERRSESRPRYQRLVSGDPALAALPAVVPK